jgi:hypothetical protein
LYFGALVDLDELKDKVPNPTDGGESNANKPLADIQTLNSKTEFKINLLHWRN